MESSQSSPNYDLDNIISINNPNSEIEELDFDLDYDPNEMYYALARENGEL